MELFLRVQGVTGTEPGWICLQLIVLNFRSSDKCANSETHCRKCEVKGNPKNNLHTLASLFYTPIC